MKASQTHRLPAAGLIQPLFPPVPIQSLAPPLSLPVETQHAGSQTCGRIGGFVGEAFPALTACVNRIYNPPRADTGLIISFLGTGVMQESEVKHHLWTLASRFMFWLFQFRLGGGQSSGKASDQFLLKDFGRQTRNPNIQWGQIFALNPFPF